MSCDYCQPTAETWKNCRCGGKKARCTNPERQHPKTPPLDHAGFHSERVLDGAGQPRTDYFFVNSLYCTAKHCRNYTEGD